jgi:hypothetical protein
MIMSRIHTCILALLMTVVMVGCNSQNVPAEHSSGTSSAPAPDPTAIPPANQVTDQWLGKWIGPEGTFLVLAKNGAKYLVEIHSLDGPATYAGTPVGDRLEFQRNGKTESIHSGSGQETGMKWLLDKKNCLVIRTGEGFCRD